MEDILAAYGAFSKHDYTCIIFEFIFQRRSFKLILLAAIAKFEELYTKYPNNMTILKSIACAYYQNVEYDKSILTFQKVTSFI